MGTIDFPTMIYVPLYPGETIQRHYQSTYVHQADSFRQRPVDLDRVWELDRLLQGLPDGPQWPEGEPGKSVESGMIAQARRHLHDAMDEHLPEAIRVQHLDVAGSLVWNADMLEGHRIAGFSTFFRIYLAIGGA